MKNISYKRIGWLCRIQIQEINAIEYIYPLMTGLLMILMSTAFHDGWTDILTWSIRMSLLTSFIAVFLISGNSVMADNGQMTKMTLPASYLEKYLSLCLMILYREIYWIAGIALSFAGFIGIAALFQTEGMLDAGGIMGIIQSLDPLVILFVPQILVLISVASATTPKIQKISAVIGVGVFCAILALDLLYRILVNDFMPEWAYLGILVLGEVPIVLWTYRNMKHIQPYRTRY